MASSSDAVRNYVFDVHIYDLRQGWAIVQQLVEKELDSWEKIYAAYPVKDLNEHASWDAEDERQISAFLQQCPLLGDKLAAQLAAQAVLFVKSPAPQPFKRGHTMRLGSLRERINRLYLSEKLPTLFNNPFSGGVRLSVGGKNPRLVPFSEAVEHPGFTA